ncbi:MAG: hypothetical protein ACI9LO_000233 [Planctomycetota bacterium]|jgi:hypothetical protein
MLFNPMRSKALLLVIFALSLIASCESGTPTVANPNLDTGGNYTGPAAKTADIQSFQQNFWEFLRKEDRCGQCHGAGQSPTFVEQNDVNAAYSKAVSYVDLQNPEKSIVVTRVAGGHHCWLTSFNACADNIEQMVINWANASNVTSARLIQLSAPEHKEPGDTKSFPEFANTAGINGRSFEDTLHPLLTLYCQDCHTETAAQPQAPFFANTSAVSAFEAAKPKMNIDSPTDSRFVVKLSDDPLRNGESHNCWSDCASDSQDMDDAIKLFADGIELTEINSDLITSKALNLSDGIVASGGSRHESNQFALWEFKTITGNTAFDTSGIDPAIDLSIIGSVTWEGNFGLNFSGGRAQADTPSSEKIHTFIQSTGQYAIEAWVVPANVTQEGSNIISYSGTDTQRNFTLGQNLYDYDFYNRVVATPAEPNGEPILSTGDNDEEILQSNLQHVVVNYDPFNGREIYVNGTLVDVTDPIPGSTTINNVWDDGFVFLLADETSGNRNWRGVIRMAALHNRVLTPAQIVQNFELGVGEKYFLLFYIGHRIGIDDSYIMFTVSRFDSFSYLFSEPRFINLDRDWEPVAINIKGLRIGINGKEAHAGQAFANLDVTVNTGEYDPQFGQLLSPIGTIIALEKSAESDEFFLTFEDLNGATFDFDDPKPAAAAYPDDPAENISSDIGIRTFEEIYASISSITTVPVDYEATTTLGTPSGIIYQKYFQQLPTVEAIDAFLPSHQMAIAQLALASCSEMVEVDRLLAPADSNRYFPNFDYTIGSDLAFDSAPERALIVTPMLIATSNFVSTGSPDNLTTQPIEDRMREALSAMGTQVLDPGLPTNTYESLITQLVNSGDNSPDRTVQIVKAVCAATVASAVTLVQ